MNTQLPRQLSILYPAAVAGKDYAVLDRSDGNGPVITQWNAAQGAQPTSAQLTTAAAQVTANDALRASLLAAFTALAPGVQAHFQGCLKSVDALLVAGQVAAAKALVSTVPVGTTLAATQAALVALFPS